MSTPRLLSLLCVVPMALFVFAETSYGQACEGASAAASIAPTSFSSGNQQGVSISGNPLLNLMRLNQFVSGPSRQSQMQQQRMIFVRQQWMMQQRELAKRQEEEKVKEEEAKAKEEALAKIEEKKEKIKRPDDGLTSDQRIQLSLLKLERSSGRTSKTSKRR
ncbi:MAG: hypothetical protein P8M30_18750 [Planctomycetaceae bacterium]|jgi:hypothetical protein|nr:hypothetical protein [bacterium]MDG2391352.1 hypothetical protein [Planctomycetaceae bacterium]